MKKKMFKIVYILIPHKYEMNKHLFKIHSFINVLSSEHIPKLFIHQSIHKLMRTDATRVNTKLRICCCLQRF